jgi:hypothetical protein
MIRRAARSRLEAKVPLRLVDGVPVEMLFFIPVSNSTHTNPLGKGSASNKVAG